MRVRNRLDSLSLLSCLPWLVSCISANGLLSLSAGSLLLSATTSQTQTADAGQKPSDGHAPDAEGWEAIRGSNSPALFEQFLKEYPNSQYAGAARLKLAALGSATTPKLPARKVVEPVILSKADPGYSEEARAARIQGTVLVVAKVDERGEAKDIKVIRGLGFGLDNRAIESVQQWRFRPGTKDGTPAEFTMAFEVEFHLPEGGPWRIEGASLGRKYEKGAPPGIETKPTLRQYVSPSAEACAQNGGYVVVQLQIDKNGATSDVKALMSPATASAMRLSRLFARGFSARRYWTKDLSLPQAGSCSHARALGFRLRKPTGQTR
jgi:TonB family protein